MDTFEWTEQTPVTANNLNEMQNIINNNILEYEDHYSSDEIKTNKVWIDGKPIYRKVFDYGQLPNNSSVGVTHNIPIDTPIECFGIVYRTSSPVNSWTLPTANIFIDLDKNQVYVTTTSDRRDLTCKAILEYTKTTD